MKLRYQSPDLLKGIAVLLMVQVHLVELFATKQLENSSLGSFLMFLGGPLVAPVFVGVFGYFLAMSKKKSEELIKRGVFIFLLGVLLNVLLNFNLLIKIINGSILFNFYPYLFGVDIFHFAGLTIIVYAFIKKWLTKNVYRPFLLCVVVSFLGSLISFVEVDNIFLEYFLAYFLGITKWSYFPLLPWFSYPLLGVAFYVIKPKLNFEKLNSHKTKTLLGLLSIIFIVTTIRYAISISANLPEYYHHGLLFFCWVLLFLIFYVFWVNQLEKKIRNTLVSRYVKWLGKYVTIFYVVQWVLIGNLATEVYKTINNWWFLLICFIGLLTLSSVVTWLISNFIKKSRVTN